MPTASPFSSPAAASSPTVASTPTISIAPRGGGDGFACFTLRDVYSGLTCLTNAGWNTFDRYSDLGDSSVSALAACPDGSLLILTSSMLSRFDGSTITTIEKGDGIFYPFNTLACAADGKIWMERKGGIGVYDGSAWTMYTVQALTEGVKDIVFTRDIVFTPDGRVWAVGVNSQVVMFDGSAWTAVKKGPGFRDGVLFYDLTVDRQGRLWALGYLGLGMYDGSQLLPVENEEGANALGFDGQGQAWLYKYDQGVYSLKNGTKTFYARSEEGLPSNKVTGMQIDANDRVWISTAWGLTILDGGIWTTYHMSNSDLPDDNIGLIAVTGAGPKLPEPKEKATGIIAGRILQADSSPLADAEVEVCVEEFEFMYHGKTPCTEHSFMASTQTDANGRFTFKNLPASHYYLTAENNGEWASLKGEYNVGFKILLVQPGQTNDLGDLTLRD